MLAVIVFDDNTYDTLAVRLCRTDEAAEALRAEIHTAHPNAVVLISDVGADAMDRCRRELSAHYERTTARRAADEAEDDAAATSAPLHAPDSEFVVWQQIMKPDGSLTFEGNAFGLGRTFNTFNDAAVAFTTNFAAGGAADERFAVIERTAGGVLDWSKVIEIHPSPGKLHDWSKPAAGIGFEIEQRQEETSNDFGETYARARRRSASSAK